MRLALLGHETTRDVLAKGQLTVLAAEAKKRWPVAAFNLGHKYVDPSWSSHVTAEGCGCHGVGAGNTTDQLVGFGPLCVQLAGFLFVWRHQSE